MKKIIVLALSILLGLLLIVGSKTFSSPRFEQTQGQALVSLVLSGVDTRSIEVEANGQVTALMGLKALVEKENLELVTKDYDFGALVQAIEGLESGSDYAWIYFVNGQSASVGAGEYILKPKDVVEWKYLSVNGGDGNE